jgi:hypothetical protein
MATPPLTKRKLDDHLATFSPADKKVKKEPGVH